MVTAQDGEGVTARTSRHVFEGWLRGRSRVHGHTGILAGFGSTRHRDRACGSSEVSRYTLPGDITLADGVYAHFDTTEGSFIIRLFDQLAPKTVENFVGLAEGTREWTDPRTNQKVKMPYYDGLIFHRVIDGFMIQGGDPLGQGIGGPGYTFRDEFHPSLRHDRAGILSMANRGPDTNGGQFFITLAPTPHLDDRHSVFGEVVEGLDVVRRIGHTPTDTRNRPQTDIVINKVAIERRP